MQTRDPRESAKKLNPWSPALSVIGSMLVLSFVAYAVRIGDMEALQPPWIAAGVVGVLLLGVWLYTESDNLRRASATRGAQYTATAVALTAVALGIAVALNVLASRYDERIDLTANKRFTLSEQTTSIMAGLPADVTVRAFFGAGSVEESEFRSLVEGYEAASDRLTVEYIDPLRNPLQAEQFEITSAFGAAVLSSGEAEERLEGEFTEETLTNALVRLTSGVEHRICFTTGHEEIDPEDDYQPAGMGALAGRLEGQNYRADTITLLREGVPADCEVVVVADPQLALMPAERELLAGHVAGGGHLLVMLEPTRDLALAESMARFGIAVGDDLILESGPNAQLFGGDLSYLLIEPSGFDFHPITADLRGYTLHRMARTVGQGAPIEGISVQELARTTANAWAKADPSQLTDPTPSAADRLGPLPIMAVAEVSDPANIAVYVPAPPAPPEADPEAPTPAPQPAEVDRAPGARVVVIGDVDFASNGLALQGNNLDLFLNTVAWMVGEEDQISIRPNEAAEGSITMNLVQGLLIWLLCLVIAPGMTLLGALQTWRRRRQR